MVGMINIKNNIRKYRENRGISLEKLAKELGLTRAYLSNLENLISVPSPILMVKISSYFNEEIGKMFYIDTR
jgi:transcriptional regulator with XRE-family HTH domain